MKDLIITITDAHAGDADEKNPNPMYASSYVFRGDLEGTELDFIRYVETYPGVIDISQLVSSRR